MFGIILNRFFLCYIIFIQSKCLAAQNWWKDNNMVWTKVRSKWSKEFAKNKNLKLKQKVNNRTLFSQLFALKPVASQEEVDKIIESFIEIN